MNIFEAMGAPTLPPDAATKVTISAINPKNEVKYACTISTDKAIKVYRRCVEILMEEMARNEEH